MSSGDHGGFVLARPPAVMFEGLRRAARDYMFREVAEAHRYTIVVTKLPATELVHVTLRGPRSTGNDMGPFHERHAALGGLIASALRVRLHRVSYENRSGSESVTSFAPDGSTTSTECVGHDDRLAELGIDLDALEGVAHAAAEEAYEATLPLTRLAESLYVTRGTLTEDPREHPAFELGLVGDVPVGALQAYLAG